METPVATKSAMETPVAIKLDAETFAATKSATEKNPSSPCVKLYKVSMAVVSNRWGYILKSSTYWIYDKSPFAGVPMYVLITDSCERELLKVRSRI